MNSGFPAFSSSVAAPCIVDRGLVVNKRDIERLLLDLGRVQYSHLEDGQELSRGEGCVREVFADPQRSTLVANRALYINVCSFDCLVLEQTEGGESCFDLVHEKRCLRLIPRSNPLVEQQERSLNAAALEAMMAEVLSANLDAQLDDDEHPLF